MYLEIMNWAKFRRSKNKYQNLKSQKKWRWNSIVYIRLMVEFTGEIRLTTPYGGE